MSSPSSSPSPSKSRWARMGGVVRRASSVLAPTRPSTPSIASDKDADSASLKGVPAAPAALIPPKPVNSHPSPIAESPARELAASEDAAPTVDPSPLAQPPVTASPEPESSPPEATLASPVQEYTPPPLIDSTAVGPGGFTDDSDDLPQTQVIRDPSFIQTDSNDEHEAPAKRPPSPPPVVAELSTPEPSTPELDTLPPGLAGAGAGSYFDIPVQEEPLEDPELTARPSEEFEQAVDEDVFGPVAAPAAPTPPERPATPAPDTQEDRQVLEPAPAAEAPEYEEPQPASEMPAPEVPVPEVPVPEVPAPEVPVPEMPTPQMPTPAPAPAVLPPAAPAYPLPPFDFHSGQEVWGGVAHGPDGGSKRGMNGDASTQSSIRMPVENPFADPVTPRITVSQPEHLPMPHPHVPEQDQQATHGSARGIVMPLPPVHEVIPSQSLRDFPSTQSLNKHFETDETLPLLSRPGSPKHTSYLQPSPTSPNIVNVSAQSSARPSAWPTTAPTHTATHGPRLHDLGWIEYHLPDSTVYYVHPTRRVTADVDLREETALDAVSAYLEQHGAGDVPPGMELWLCESGEAAGTRWVWNPVRLWVDHKQRKVVAGSSDPGRGRKKVEDDQLDAEYRYWSFMEAHPAHTALPHNARAEATDVLTWAWTDRLLPSHHSVPAPFTQEECQELMSLLRSFDQGEGGLQTVVHTRIVSRILLRVAHWRQHHFRPNKPLPTDVGHRDLSLPKPRRPLHRALLDLTISCLCLGIPYLFAQSRSYRLDEESGTRHSSPGPMFIVGACTCLIAAVVLSASVTFLSLPGLDAFARVAGFVAVLFATFSMASTLVALFRYKAELENPVAHIGGEGLMMLSRRSVVFSLPMVFLAYAIVGFITGIVLYSFRGVANDPLATQHPFEDYTRWTVVGVLGGLAGVLTTSLLLLRR